MRAYECVSFGMRFCVAREVVNSAVQEKFFFDCLALKMKALQPFETLWTTQTKTHHHIPEDMTLKQWNTFLFSNKQKTRLCICGLTLQNKKHNTHNSLNHTAIHIMIQHLKLCTFQHWVYSYVSTIIRINNDYFSKTVLIDLSLSWRYTVFQWQRNWIFEECIDKFQTSKY
jgi:hypothetical protein